MTALATGGAGAEERAGRATPADHPEVDRLLARYREPLGAAFDAYRGHVHRVHHFCCALAGDRPGLADRVAVAAVHHDLGVWTHRTADYLEPSAALAREHLRESGRSEWIPEVEAMILEHHKLSPCRGAHAAVAEPFRRADLVDLCFGRLALGVPAELRARMRARHPHAGFHGIVTRAVLGWALRHPTRPFPMMRL